ncbi:MAG: hypothetical protein Q3972_00515 [Corynebacterium sp.]|nr:hypothetical protein [Corynebacterium sp.]
MKSMKIVLSLTMAGLCTMSALPAQAATAQKTDNTCTMMLSAEDKATVATARAELISFLKKDYAERVRPYLLETKRFEDKDLVSAEAFDPTAFISSVEFSEKLTQDQLENLGSPLKYFAKADQTLTGYEQYRYQNWANYIALGVAELSLTDSGKALIQNPGEQQTRVLRSVDQAMLSAVQKYWDVYVNQQLGAINSCLSELGSSIQYSDTSLVYTAPPSAENQLLRLLSKGSSGLSSAVGSSNWVHLN